MPPPHPPPHPHPHPTSPPPTPPQERGFETCQLHSRHWLLMDERGQGEQACGGQS